jgi:hypothetical protein
MTGHLQVDIAAPDVPDALVAISDAVATKAALMLKKGQGEHRVNMVLYS